jgi:hypothetical protein
VDHALDRIPRSFLEAQMQQRIAGIPVGRRARPPDGRPRAPTTRPRGNPEADMALVRDGLARLQRVLGH